ncbi:MAG: tRNA 4-thiouridine(8) synthase ThiI [Parcubacteria group bacterium]|nr:tRNA 4-thiouridine(8) synthase ThiI [Parcubacteria group bacterium]
MHNYIIIHYHEIALKGGNRSYFEKKLCENIKKALNDLEYDRIERQWGRILIRLNTKSDFEKIKSKLNLVFGIAYFFKSIQIDSDFENLKKESLKIFKKEHKEKEFKTFKVNTRRIDKSYSLDSQEINMKVGECILENISDLSVKMKNQDYTLYIDILGKDKALIYSEKIKGQGGLPSGTSGKIISLISSGFDSPVASYQVMKRGARIVFVHFHSYPQTNKASLDNVKKIVKILNQYQFKSTLYLVPFLNIQKEIHLKCNPALKVILYRRLMIRIAERITEQDGVKAIVTGESLGQVASQTLENIQAINESATLPVLRPLIGTDKEDIINEARIIGTHNISSAPDEDCCSLFVPKHPETRAKLENALREEKKIDIEKIIDESLGEVEKIQYK